MKKQPVKIYWRNCQIKFTEFVREGVGSEAKFHLHFHTISDALVIQTEGKKTIEYIISHGVEYKHLKKRSKSLKFKGVRVSKEIFDGIVREWKFEVAEAKENMIKTIDKKIEKQNPEIDLDNFPFIK